MATYLTLASYVAAYWLMGELFATYRRAVLRENQEDALRPDAARRSHQGLIWFSAADWVYFVAAVLLASRDTDGWRLRSCIMLAPLAFANSVRFCSRLALLYRDRASTLAHSRETASRHTLTSEALLSEINFVQKGALLLLSILTVMPLINEMAPSLGKLSLDVTLYGFFAYSVLPGISALILLSPTLLRLRRASLAASRA